MDIVETINNTRSGVLRVVLEKNRDSLTNGTAFLTPQGLVTNSHVIRACDYGALAFYAEGSKEPIRLLKETIDSKIKYESPVAEYDFVVIEIDEPEFGEKHVYEFGDPTSIKIGSNIIFHGFPFNMPQLTSHHGFISSIHRNGSTNIIQIDGSVNGGNSGGPLIDPACGKVIGIITRAISGYIAGEFDQLICQMSENIGYLEQLGEVMQVGGFRAVHSMKATQIAMQKIAINLRRSSNVGIGYAYSIEHLLERIG